MLGQFRNWNYLAVFSRYFHNFRLKYALPNKGVKFSMKSGHNTIPFDLILQADIKSNTTVLWFRKKFYFISQEPIPPMDGSLKMDCRASQ